LHPLVGFGPLRDVQPNIAYAPGAEDSTLALWAGSLIETNVRETPAAARDFAAMRAAVAMVAPDRRPAITLRFNLGQLTIHESMIGVPDVTLCADYEILTGLERLPISRIGRLPLAGWSAPAHRRRAWRKALFDLVSGDLKIYGLWAHPRLVTRLLRLLAQPQRLDAAT
jgi:hypothetical protein